MDLIDKEVKVIKLKIIKVIYIQLESSFLQAQGKKSTKDLITLLRALAENKSLIDLRLLLSRAKFIKDQVQASVLKAGASKLESVQTQTAITTQVLNYLKANIEEFTLFKLDYEEWLIDRLTEVRSIISVFVSKINKIADLVILQNCILSFNMINSEL